MVLDKNPEAKKAVFINQIRKLYNKPLIINDSERTEKKNLRRKFSSLKQNERGFYEFAHYAAKNPRKESNYYSYVKRYCSIFEEDHFMNQIRKRKHVVFGSVSLTV